MEREALLGIIIFLIVILIAAAFVYMYLYGFDISKIFPVSV